MSSYPMSNAFAHRSRMLPVGAPVMAQPGFHAPTLGAPQDGTQPPQVQPPIQVQSPAPPPMPPGAPQNILAQRAGMMPATNTNDMARPVVGAPVLAQPGFRPEMQPNPLPQPQAMPQPGMQPNPAAMDPRMQHPDVQNFMRQRMLGMGIA